MMTGARGTDHNATTSERPGHAEATNTTLSARKYTK